DVRIARVKLVRRRIDFVVTALDEGPGGGLQRRGRTPGSLGRAVGGQNQEGERGDQQADRDQARRRRIRPSERRSLMRSHRDPYYRLPVRCRGLSLLG